MEPEPTPEERQQALDELARVRVRDILLQTAFNLSTVASARLGLAPETERLRDLGEARRAIDALTGVVPLLAGDLSQPELAEVRQMVAGLQMAYAQVAAGGGGGTAPDGAEPGPTPPSEPPREAPPRQPPAPERPPIWTPRGDV